MPTVFADCRGAGSNLSPVRSHLVHTAGCFLHRFAMYLLVPLGAWIGAALVEKVVDSVLAAQ